MFNLGCDVQFESIEIIKIYKDNMILIFSLWFILFLVFSIVNIISIFQDYKYNKSEKLLKKMRRIKLGLIPFWVINFISYLYIIIIFIITPTGIFAVFFIVPIFIFVSYIVLLLTSTFSISYLFSIRKNGIIQNKDFIIHSIIQFLFVFDIIDVTYILKKWGKPNNELLVR